MILNLQPDLVVRTSLRGRFYHGPYHGVSREANLDVGIGSILENRGPDQRCERHFRGRRRKKEKKKKEKSGERYQY